MLVRIPNGDWINPTTISGVRLMVADKMGPRVLIDTVQEIAHYMVEFDNPETAREWTERFGQECNATMVRQSA